MRKARGVEIQADLLLLGPRNPLGKMPRLKLIPRHLLAGVIRVDRMQAQAMPAREQVVDELKISPQLIRRAGLAGVVARGLDAAAGQALVVLEAADIVALPAVERDRYPGKLLKRPVDIHTQRGVALLREHESLCDRFFALVHNLTSFIVAGFAS